MNDSRWWFLFLLWRKSVKIKLSFRFKSNTSQHKANKRQKMNKVLLYPWTNCSRRPWSGPFCLFRDPTCCFFSLLCCRSWGRSSLYTWTHTHHKHYWSSVSCWSAETPKLGLKKASSDQFWKVYQLSGPPVVQIWLNAHRVLKAKTCFIWKRNVFCLFVCFCFFKSGCIKIRVTEQL